MPTTVCDCVLRVNRQIVLLQHDGLRLLRRRHRAVSEMLARCPGESMLQRVHVARPVLRHRILRSYVRLAERLRELHVHHRVGAVCLLVDYTVVQSLIICLFIVTLLGE